MRIKTEQLTSTPQKRQGKTEKLPEVEDCRTENKETQVGWGLVQEPLRGEQKLCCAVVAVVDYLPGLHKVLGLPSTADKGGKLRC